MRVVIIDYGAGNTANVKNAFEKLGENAKVSANKKELREADALILPGVGAFGAAMKRLQNKEKLILDLIENGKPFLGICLGMQLLLDKSDEDNGVKGFGIISGEVKKFSLNLPVPQIGWNLVENLNSSLFDGFDDNFYAYFVHSYYCDPKDKCVVAATTNYGITFPSAFTKKNIFATQFHPEKSGEKGLQILQNFIREVKR